MKKILIVLIINVLIWQFDTIKGNTLPLSNTPGNDKVYFFTDRNLYVASEPILFSSFIENSSGLRSSVLYVEIVSQDGLAFYSSKFRISGQKANGSIHIPTDIPTGTYFVKAYTKWMRNFSPDSYAYVPIKLINLSSNTLGAKKNGKNGSNGAYVNFEKVDFSNYIIESNKNTYKPREEATLTLNNQTLDAEFVWSCLSIVPSAAIDYSYNITNGSKSKEPVIVYQPEQEGISISGKVIKAESEELVPHALVNISILGPYPDFIPVRTDFNGYFNLNLPAINGKYDLYIGIEGDTQNRVIIDNDFCTKSNGINYTLFSISDKEQQAAQNILNNIEVSKQFPIPTNPLSSDTHLAFQTLDPFYGTPDVVFEFKKYVDLLSIKEYFFELIPVSVRERKGIVTFGFPENYAEFKMFDPLLMIDNVVVTDASRILAADPNLLSKIEIISKPYYKGNMVYGGVVSFFSKKGDFAGIELPSSDIFLNYKFFDNGPNVNYPNFINENLPDTRTTILWNSDLQMDKDVPTVVTFQTPDTKGDYDILLRGITSKGKVMFIRHTIKVE